MSENTLSYNFLPQGFGKSGRIIFYKSLWGNNLLCESYSDGPGLMVNFVKKLINKCPICQKKKFFFFKVLVNLGVTPSTRVCGEIIFCENLI